VLPCGVPFLHTDHARVKEALALTTNCDQANAMRTHLPGAFFVGKRAATTFVVPKICGLAGLISNRVLHLDPGLTLGTMRAS
jgi:hypothetical protein